MNTSQEGSDDEDMPVFAFNCKQASNLLEDQEEAAANFDIET